MTQRSTTSAAGSATASPSTSATTPAPGDRPTKETAARVQPAASPAPRATLPPGTLLGDWRIEAAIGEGGMGTVYEAVHDVIGKRAAIKVVRSDVCAIPGGAARLVEEARLVNQVGHANIVDIFHIGQLDDGRPYLVMELLRGRTLGQRIADERVPPTEAIDVLLAICDALVAAHARGVVHRDLKPENVFLVDGAGAAHVKLVDWGIAKAMDRPRGGALTTSGMLVGTPQYMSPEQARGRGVDGRSDVYSLGAIAYELFAARPPFVADNVADLVTMHLRELPAAPSGAWPDIPPELERLLIAMLAKEPADRPSLAQVIDGLRAARAQLESQRQWGRSAPFASASPPPVAVLDRTPTWNTRRTRAGGPSPQPDARRTDGGGLAARSVADAARPRGRGGRVLGALGLCVAAGMIAFLALAPDGAPTADAARAAAVRAPTVPAHPVAAVGPVTMPVVDAAVGDPPIPEVASPSTLDLRFSPTSAGITVDGEPASAAGGRVHRTVDPGTVEIVVEAPGFRSYRRTIEVRPGGSVLIEVALERAATGRPSDASPRAVSRRPPTIDPDGTIDPFE